MQKKSLSNLVKILLIIVPALLLILIRTFEENLFYDPFLDYFEKDFNKLPLPPINNFELIIGLAARYFLNTVLSLAIIYLVIKDFDAVKFACFLYVLFFIILLSILFYLILQNGQINKMTLFYVRRFLIQPLFLLLFLPAFYYQKQKI
jgi:exosortase F-associated protein